MEKLLVGSHEVVFDYKIKDGCVIGTFHSDFMDLSIAQKVTEYRLKLQKGKAYPLLSNVKTIKNSTKSARDFMASEEGCKGVVVAAVLIDSPVGSIIINFFIRVSKPLRPTKIFTNEEEAKKWLSQFVK
ncbi:MAG: hypothetical protein V4549_12090 [Bacteroidota bacterium]|jgi:hypothetical protein